MVGHGGSSAGSYLADPTSPIPSHCAPIVATSTFHIQSCILISSHCGQKAHWHGTVPSLPRTPMEVSSLCKKASNHHANLPLEMYSFTL